MEPIFASVPGAGNKPLQCFIERNKKNSTFYLYLGLSPFMEKGKFLLAARKIRHGTHTEYIISLDADDFSQGSNAYVGKLSSDFFGKNHTIYHGQPPFDGAKPSSSRASRRFASKQISPHVSAGNFEIGHVSYKGSLLKPRPRKMMLCTLQCPTTKQNIVAEQPPENTVCGSSMVLKNKAPRWHELRKCWCLNFHGRVTVASVRNFQILAPVDLSQPGSKGDDETVLLQFRKVGDDIFTMDYRQPLSTFVAFAICLTSFGPNLAFP